MAINFWGLIHTEISNHISQTIWHKTVSLYKSYWLFSTQNYSDGEYLPEYVTIFPDELYMAVGSCYRVWPKYFVLHSSGHPMVHGNLTNTNGLTGAGPSRKFFIGHNCQSYAGGMIVGFVILCRSPNIFDYQLFVVKGIMSSIMVHYTIPKMFLSWKTRRA